MPKRIPDHLKVVKGTAQKCRMNPNAPAPDPGRPDAPDTLTARELYHFNRYLDLIAELGIDSPVDVDAVAMMAQLTVQIEETSEIINALGYTVEKTYSHGVNTVANPAVAQRERAMKALKVVLSEFGLTPASRMRVSVTDGRKKTNPFTKREAK